MNLGLLRWSWGRLNVLFVCKLVMRWGVFGRGNGGLGGCAWSLVEMVMIIAVFGVVVEMQEGRGWGKRGRNMCAVVLL